MASLDLRRILERTAKLLTLAAAVTPCTGFSQPPTSNDRERQLTEKIQDVQSRDGPHSEDLISLWTALSLSYEEEGLHTFAAAAIEQARQVVRANHGLYSLQEASLIRRAIDNHRARGNIEAAWNLEQDLLSLAQRYPEDLRTVSILREIADRRLDVLGRYIAGDAPPEVFLGCYYRGGPGAHYPQDAFAETRRRRHGLRGPIGPGAQRPQDSFVQGTNRKCDAGSRSSAIGSLRRETQSHYGDAIDVIVRNGLYSSDELRELEMQLIRMSYSSPYYDFGKQSYRRLVGYNAASSAPWLARITTFVEMADWDLLIYWHWRSQTRGARGAVLESYEQAYELLEQKGIAQTSIDELFSPDTPVVLPTFLSNPFASRDSSESARHIDVAFDITKYGRGEHVEIHETTSNATAAEQADLVRLIKRSVFRPRVRDGRLADESRVVVRYFLDDGGTR